MGTDLPLNVGGSREVSGPRAVGDIAPRRMAHSSERTVGRMKETEERGRSGQSEFERTYREVAEANAKAHSTTDDTTSRSEAVRREKRCRVEQAGEPSGPHGGWDTEESAVVESVEVPDAEMFDGVDHEGNVVMSDSVDRAAIMIRRTLTVVKEVFELSIQGSIEELDLRNPSEEVVEQFAEILALLKSMTGLLDEAVKEGVALDIGDRCLEPEQMVAMEKTLRVETFRLQMAFEKLGVASEVNTLLAGKLDQLLSAGIPQAIDPSSMTSHDAVVRMFEDLVNAKTEDVRAIVEKMAALAKQPKPGTIATGELRVEGSVSVKVLSMETSRPVADIGTLDPQVLRKLLKIDGDAGASAEKGVVQGEAKAGGEMKGVAIGAVSQLEQFRNVLDSTGQSTEPVGATEATRASQSVTNGADAIPRNLGTPFRTMEEQVVRQLTERLHTAVRNGATEVRLTLRPESLGQVQLKIQMDGDIVMAKINVESQQVRQIVESNLQSLRNALEEHNLQAGDFDVNVGHRWADQAGDERKPGRRVGAGGRGDQESDWGSDHESAQAVGRETGRRYGTNTVEYFA